MGESRSLQPNNCYSTRAASQLTPDPDGDDQIARDVGMAATLTGEHYIRSTNQWSDPSTQMWLYNHDAEGSADRFLDARLNVVRKPVGGVQEMKDVGLL